MIDRLTLLTGVDIPIKQAGIVLHPPKLKEIGLVGEKFFYSAISIFFLSWESFSKEDSNYFKGKTNLQLILDVLNNENFVKIKNDTMLLFQLLFPLYQVEMTDENMIFKTQNGKQTIDSEKFEIIKTTCLEALCLNSAGDEYNPATKGAAEIAEKIKKNKERIKRNRQEEIDLLSRTASIVSVATNISINEINNYTIYQLFDIYMRYQYKNAFDRCVAIQLAGGKIEDKDKPDNWNINIYKK